MAIRDANRLTSLDALRGMSSIGVCFFFHYIHFVGTPFSAETYPFGHVFSWFYRHGWLMVDFFFVLSGFVFSHMYRDRISGGRISFGKYAYFRFSRLYPLSILTLLVVMVLQYTRHMAGMGFFIYQMNDLANFIINIFFLQGIISNGWSFNAPSWAISVQLLAYALFFLLIRYLNRWRLLVYVLMIALGLHFRYWNNSLLQVTNIARVLLGFFAGCIAHDLHMWVHLRAGSRKAPVYILTAVCLAMTVCLPVLGIFREQTSIPNWTTWYTLTVFPAAILLSINSRLLTYLFSFRPFGIFGDISFSIYLLHYPVQLLLVTIFQAAAVNVNYFSPWFFLFFFVLTSGLAYVVYNGFEKKAQDRLRTLYEKKWGK